MSDLWQYLLSQVHTNDFFSGAALAGILLATLNYVRQGAARLAKAIGRRVVVSMSVHSEDRMYVPLAKWLKANRFDAFAQRYRLRTIVTDDSLPRRVGEINEISASAPVLGPDYGTYLFRYRRRWLCVTVSKESEATGQGSSARAQTREFLKISYLGISRSMLDSIVAEVLQEERAATEWRLPVSQANAYGWVAAGSLLRTPQGVCPVVLADHILEDLLADIAAFFQKQVWYAERGIPWRRGYLLYGPPGTGKTSLIRFVARYFGLAIHIIDSLGYLNADIAAALKNVPPRSLVVFEDIDCHDITSRGASGNKAGAGGDTLISMNLGTLLNAIDGVNPPEQVLIFMTSNDPDRLDAALLRPGRIDRKIHLDLCTREHALRLLFKFFPDADPDSADVAAFSFAVGDRLYSPADLQGIFVTAESVGRGRARALPPSATRDGCRMNVTEPLTARSNGLYSCHVRERDDRRQNRWRVSLALLHDHVDHSNTLVVGRWHAGNVDDVVEPLRAGERGSESAPHGCVETSEIKHCRFQRRRFEAHVRGGELAKKFDRAQVLSLSAPLEFWEIVHQSVDHDELALDGHGERDRIPLLTIRNPSCSVLVDANRSLRRASRLPCCPRRRERAGTGQQCRYRAPVYFPRGAEPEQGASPADRSPIMVAL